MLLFDGLCLAYSRIHMQTKVLQRRLQMFEIFELHYEQNCVRIGQSKES